MFDKLGPLGVVGAVLVAVGLAVVAVGNPIVAAGLTLVFIGTGLVVKALVGNLMRTWGMA